METQNENWTQIKPDLNDSTIWKPENKGDTITGILSRKAENIGVNESRAYYIENSDGNFMIWGSAILDNLMSKVIPGEHVRVTFDGKEKSEKNPGRMVNLYRVEINDKTNPLLKPSGKTL